MLLEKARQSSKSKDESLKKLEENLQNLENKAREKESICRAQQEKIKELEGHLDMKFNLHNQTEKQVSQLSEKLKAREEVCNSLQQKIKELENKLKEQLQDSESHSLALQQKNKELERKLKDREHNSEMLLLQQKIKEQEDKIRELENQLQSAQTRDISDTRATPSEAKTCPRHNEFLMNIEPNVLRNSNSMKRPLSHGSALPKGNESIIETRKKRQSRGSETENNVIPILVPAPFHDSSRGRKSDPPKVARVGMRTTTKPVGVTAGNGTLTQKRIVREQTHGARERDAKKKIWNR